MVGRFDIDFIQTAGSDPLQMSHDDLTYVDVVSTHPAHGGWSHFSGAEATRTNPTIYLRSKAGNAFTLDFVSYWTRRDDEAGNAMAPFYGARLTTNTAIGRDRIHSTNTTTGGTAGEQGINLIRSQTSHGMFAEFSYQVAGLAGDILASVGGYALFKNADDTLSIGPNGNPSATLTVPLVRDAAGLGAVRNKVLYWLEPAGLRVAVNGVLYTLGTVADPTTSTHDFMSAGAGGSPQAFLRRLTWFAITRAA